MIAIYDNGVDSGVVYGYIELHNATFSPESSYIVLDLPRGNWTRECRKDMLRELAIDVNNFISNHDIVLSWGEWAEIDNWFYKYGKRYGMLREFHENGIC